MDLLSHEQKNNERFNKIKLNHELFLDDIYFINYDLCLRRGGSCHRCSDSFGDNFLIFYKNKLMFQLYIESDQNGTYAVKLNYDKDGKNITFKTKNLHDHIEMEKFQNYLKLYSEIIQHNYDYLNKKMNITYLVDIQTLYIGNEKYKYNTMIFSSPDKCVHIFECDEKYERIYKKTYLSIEHFVLDNEQYLTTWNKFKSLF